MISYRKLILKLKEKGISQYKLKKWEKDEAGNYTSFIGSATITKLFDKDGINGNAVDIRVIDKMCKLLNCQPGDILECVPDDTVPGYKDTSERHNNNTEGKTNRSKKETE